MRNDLPRRRRELGLTQEQLAARLGVTRQTVISIERGRFDPSLPLAFRIADELGATIHDIFDPAAGDPP